MKKRNEGKTLPTENTFLHGISGNQSLNSNYMSNCLTNKLYWQEIKTNLKVNHEKGNTTNYNTIVLLHTIL